MAKKHWTAGATEMDYVGNNAAFTCPHSGRVFLVSAVFILHREGSKVGTVAGSARGAIKQRGT